MNRLIVITMLVLVVPAALFAQIGWTEHPIDSIFTQANSVYAIDMDGDGDVDVLGGGNGVTWWENDGATIPNFTPHTIDSTFKAKSVYAIDMEPDGDIDVLGASNSLDDITWWENDGNEIFTKHTIDGTFDGANSVYAIDVDGDGDVDVLGAAMIDHEITWWENDGSEIFTKDIIASGFAGAFSVYAIDVDGDGNVDVLGAAGIADDITWWKNDGLIPPNFTPDTIADNFNFAQSVYAIDIEPDGDIDVLGAAMIDHEITWWENDGSEIFTEHTIDGSFGAAKSVYAIDLDNDGDVDVLGGGNGVTWYENDSVSPVPGFTKHAIDANFGGASVYGIDIDNDTDVDVLGAGLYGITWWSSGLILTDVRTLFINIPPEVPQNTTLNPQARVMNLGSDTVTFDVTCEIDPGAYTNTTTVTDLRPGKNVWANFDEFTFVSGFYTVTVYTQLAGDQNPGNDTLVKVIKVPIYDVGPVSIDIPDTLPQDSTLNPKATVKNLGTQTASLDVTCEIEPGAYTKTETVTDLAAVDSIQVTFLDEFTFVSGSYTVTVYTQLADSIDENPGNDTLVKVIATGVTEGGSVTPTSFSFGLKSNPIRGKAVFNLLLPKNASVTLEIYDVSGRLVAVPTEGRKSAGNHTITWTPKTNGIYFYSMESSYGTRTGKILSIK